MKRFYTVMLVAGVVLLSVILRFWQLGAVPLSPDWDEAALGYNAYSVLKTGRDEYGTFLPLSLRSFDDYKPPLYMYLAIGPIALFGLETWAVRLPSAIAGVLAVIGTFFLVRELLKTKGQETICNAPLLSSALLAISPWHIQFSRIAFEANVGLTINIWAAYFFLRGFYSRCGFVISAALFALAMYTYHSERIFVPLLLVFLLFIFRKSILPKSKGKIMTAFIVGFIMLLPLVPVLLNKNSLTRLKGTSSFREQTEILSGNIKKLEYDRSHGYWLGELFDNRRVEYAKIIIRGYLAHFSLKWLFISGDHERHHAPEMGLLYFWELPFILIGIYQLLKKKEPSNLFFLGWFALAPVAASPTTQLPHAIRTLVFLPSFQVFTAIGLLSSYSYMKTRFPKWKSLLSIGMGTVIIGTFLYYTHMYFVHTNREYSKFWQYGYKQAVDYAEAHSGEYEKIVVSTDLEQPYIFFLFYSKHDPKKYLAQGGTLSGRFDEKFNHFNKYEFRKIDWPNEKRDGSTLYIGTPDEIVHGTKVNITYLDGTPAIHITDRE